MVNKWLDIQDRVVAHNFWFNVLDGAFFSFAMSFLGMVTVLPVFVKKLGGNEIAIGLIPVLWALGFNLPQILIAPYVRSLKVKKGFVLRTALMQRLPWLFIALMSVMIGSIITLKAGLLLFFILFFITALTNGINLPGWFDLVSKITPVKLRGRLFGLRSVLGAFLGIIGGWLVHMILDQIRFPYNFSLLFMSGFILTIVSLFFLVGLKEKESEEFAPLIRGWRKYTASAYFLKNDRNFAAFLTADVLMILAFTGNAFITVFALEKFGLPVENIGLFTMLMMGSLIVGSLFFGILGDRFGHRMNLVIAALFTVISALVAVFSTTVTVYLGVFVLTAMTTGIMMVSRLTLLAELSPARERASYVGLMHLVGLPFALSGILGGWAASNWGCEIVFVFSGVFAGIAVIVWTIMVKEPRYFPAGTIPGRQFGN